MVPLPHGDVTVLQFLREIETRSGRDDLCELYVRVAGEPGRRRLSPHGRVLEVVASTDELIATCRNLAIPSFRELRRETRR